VAYCVEKYSELNGDGKLWVIGVIIEDWMFFDAVDKCLKDMRQNMKFSVEFFWCMKHPF